MSAPYIRGYLNSQKKHHSMDGTKLSMTFATKSAAPKLPYLEQDSPHRGHSSVLFLRFFTKKCYPQKRLSKTCVILMAS